MSYTYHEALFLIAKVLTVNKNALGLALLPCTNGIGCITYITGFIRSLDFFQGYGAPLS